MSTPPAPSSRLDEATIFTTPLTWTVAADYTLWFRADLHGEWIYMRMNPTFPDEPAYSLLVASGETIEFNDLPKVWCREGPLDWPGLSDFRST